MEGEHGDIEYKLCNLLMQYRRTPHITTGESPFNSMFGREMRTRLTVLNERPQQSELNTSRITRHFNIGDKVQVRVYRRNNKWVFGTIIRKEGNVHYIVRVNEEEWRRHVDQLRKCSYDEAEAGEGTPKWIIGLPELEKGKELTMDTEDQSTKEDSQANEDELAENPTHPGRPKRNRRAPDRFGY